MDQNQMDLFRTVCFLALMQHSKGLIMKSPKYIQEKMKASKDPTAAWNMLDGEGHDKVWLWARHWNFPLMACLEEISREEVTL